MIIFPENLITGAIVFTAEKGLISWAIRKMTRFEYSHVAFYLGNSFLVESNFRGVEIVEIDKYLNNPKTVIKVIKSPLSPAQIEQMKVWLLSEIEKRFDYALIIGHAITKMLLKSKRNWFLRLLDGDGWICSELIAEGLSRAGIDIGKPSHQITPKDLYSILLRETKT